MFYTIAIKRMAYLYIIVTVVYSPWTIVQVNAF